MTVNAMIKRTNHALAILLTAVLGLVATTASAAKPELPPGMAKYVMVLWTPGTPGPASEKIKKLEPPDVEKLGGKVLKKNENRHEILLPKAAAKQLRKHSAVVYLQRIWMGESLADWDDRYEPKKAGYDVGTESDVDIDWVRAFDYDKSGNIKQFGTDHFIYDTAGRLVRAEVGDKVETFKYDDFGNLIEKAVAGGNPVLMPVDGSSNRMTGPEYDAAGNVTTRGGRRAYEYDAVNMLTRVYATPSYSRRMLYDGDDQRLGMMVDGDSLSRWTIRGVDGMILREYRGESAGMGTWVWELDQIYADGKLVAGDKQPFQYFEDGATYGGMRHYHLDHLGSVRVVTDSQGKSISEHEYYPYGVTKTRTYQEQINWGDPHLDSMRFAGHWRDFLGLLNVENTEYLDYMHARYYDPNLGRFLSADPKHRYEASDTPQLFNRYSYGLNNPLRLVDPDGRDPKAFLLVTGKPTDPIRHSALHIRDDDPASKVDLVYSHGGQASGVSSLQKYLAAYNSTKDPTTAYLLNMTSKEVKTLRTNLDSNYTITNGRYVPNQEYQSFANNCAQFSCRAITSSTDLNMFQQAAANYMKVTNQPVFTFQLMEFLTVTRLMKLHGISAEDEEALKKVAPPPDEEEEKKEP
jgi:RHS repeat-associated protein